MTIQSFQSDDLRKVAEDFNIDALVLHGSAVDSDDYNDIDICYIGKRLEFENLLDLSDRLADVFKEDNIDIAYWSDASSLLKN